MILSTTQSFKSSFCSCPQRKRLRAVPAHSSLKLSHMLLAAMLGVVSVRAMHNSSSADTTTSHHSARIGPAVRNSLNDVLNGMGNASDLNMNEFKTYVLHMTNTCSRCGGDGTRQAVTTCRDCLGNGRYKHYNRPVEQDEKDEPIQQENTIHQDDYRKEDMDTIDRLAVALAEISGKHPAIEDIPKLPLIKSSEIQALKTYMEELTDSDSPHDKQLVARLVTEKVDLDCLNENVEKLTQVFKELTEVYRIHKEVKAQTDAKTIENVEKLKTLRNIKKDAIARNKKAYEAKSKVALAEYTKKRNFGYEYIRMKRKRQKEARKEYGYGMKGGYEKYVADKPASADSMEKKLAELHPKLFGRKTLGRINGFFRGTTWSVKEMERLGFAEKCDVCADAGTVKIGKFSNAKKRAEQCITHGCNHGRWWNTCRKPCPGCGGKTECKVYLNARIYDTRAPNGRYYKEGTKCDLTALDNSYFNLTPQARITLPDGVSHKIDSIKLLSKREQESPQVSRQSSRRSNTGH